MSRFTEVVFRHPGAGVTRVYLMSADVDGETVIYRARDYLRADPRNDGLEERAFEFVRFNAPPLGPTAEELKARPVWAPAPPVRPVEVAPAPVLTVVDGGKKKAPVAW